MSLSAQPSWAKPESLTAGPHLVRTSIWVKHLVHKLNELGWTLKIFWAQNLSLGWIEHVPFSARLNEVSNNVFILRPNTPRGGGGDMYYALGYLFMCTKKKKKKSNRRI